MNTAYQKRKPWRNAGGHGATAKQAKFVRALERITGTEPADLRDMTRADVGDYIALLEFRKKRKRRT